MKNLYLTLLATFFIGSQTGLLKAQSNSVVLIPATGSSQLFASITSAYGAIPSNLSSGNNYIIELLSVYDGTDPSESYPIQLTDKHLPAGGSTITIRPGVGNIGETIRRPRLGVGNLIEINGGTNIIIDGRPGGINSSPADYLNVVDTYLRTNNSNILLKNGACNNTIQYLNAIALSGDQYDGNRILNIGTSPTGLPNSHNRILNNIITGGYRGIQVGGTVAINTGNVISFNVIRDFSFSGIYGGPTFNDSSYISNNTITCSYRSVLKLTGIYMEGESTITNIIANTITSSLPTSGITAITGIQVTPQKGSTASANILNNVIFNLTSPTANNINGIAVCPAVIFNIKNNIITYCVAQSGRVVGIGSSPSYPGSTLNISENQITALKCGGNASVGVIGIDINPYLGNCVNNVYNNFVSITDPNPDVVIKGIEISTPYSTPTAPYTTNIFFNSIRIGGLALGLQSGIVCAGISKLDNYTGSTYNQKNNVCVIDRVAGISGKVLSGFILSNTSGVLNIDYNTYYGAPGINNTSSSYWVNTPYNNLELTNYRLAAYPHEQHSNFANVFFQSNTDLHLAGSSLTNLGLTGVPIATINSDIDNNPRKSSLPTRGADENILTNIVTNVKVGLWSDISVWSNNAVPTPSDNVLIDYDITIDIDSFCKSLYLNGHNANVNANVILTTGP